MTRRIALASLVAFLFFCVAGSAPLAKELPMPVKSVDMTSDYLYGAKPGTIQPNEESKDAFEDTSAFGISEVVIGGGWHDVGLFGRNEEDGADVNAEIRFRPLTGNFWSYLPQPRPHVGVHVNTTGNTNQLFVGLTWLFDLGSFFFAGWSLGLSAHDGETDTDASSKKQFGLSVLLRQSLEVGLRVTPNHALSAMVDHISNGGLDEDNEGMETFGLRYAYRL